MRGRASASSATTPLSGDCPRRDVALFFIFYRTRALLMIIKTRQTRGAMEVPAMLCDVL